MSQKSVPIVATLTAGTHWICTCGQSKNQPYCDGNHQGTTFQPLALVLEAPKAVEVSHE